MKISIEKAVLQLSILLIPSIVCVGFSLAGKAVGGSRLDFKSFTNNRR